MIIGLTGLKGSGKDTVGAYLVKEHSFERRSFAEPLKRSFAALFDIPMWEIENWKNDDTVFVTVGNKNQPDPKVTDFINSEIQAGRPPGFEDFEFVPPDNMWSPIREHTFREALQRYGTESHRDVFGDDFWTDQALPVEGFYDGRAVVITDVRFQNEVDRIHELGGFVAKVLRPDTTVQSDLHVSEIEQFNIAEDYRIVNDRSIEFLYKEIEFMLDKLGTRHGKWPGER